MSSNLYTAAGYVVIIGAAGVVYYLTRKDGAGGRNVKNKIQKTTQNTRQAIKAKTEKIEAAIGSGIDTSSQEKKNKKKSKSKAPTPAPAPVKESKPSPSKADSKDDATDDVDNVAFAKQLAAARNGQVGPAKSQTATKQKSVKQSKAAAQKSNSVAKNESAPSSNAGDGDDDLSPAEEIAGPTSSNDVSDMLEAPQAGPGSLRIIESTNPLPQKAKKAAATPAQPLTKTQKKNKKKAEEQKAQRAVDEVERKKLEETQRRTARIAEGRAAKDGSAFVPANPPKQTVWTDSPATNGQSQASTTSSDELLDTFEPAAKTAPLKGIKSNSILSHLPSEEEQMRLMNESLTEWQDVPSKKNKKNSAAATIENAQTGSNPATQENVKPLARETVKPAEKPKQASRTIKEDPELSSWATGSSATPTTTFAEADEWEVS